MLDLAYITDAIRGAVSARQAGEALGLRPDKYGRCPCPVHQGHDRNCKLWPDDRGFFCYVCHAGGDVIRLVQLAQGCTFPDAIRWIDGAFHLGLPIDRPMDKNAAEAAKTALKWKRAEQARKEAIDRAEFDLYATAGRLANALEADKERYRPRRANEEWDPRFCAALRMLAEARELAEELATETMGRDKNGEHRTERLPVLRRASGHETD